MRISPEIFPAAFLFAILSVSADEPAPPSNLPITVMVDSRIPPPKNGVITVPYDSREFRILVGNPNPPHSTKSDRLRYKLEGFDTEWRENTSFMYLSICFYDADNNQIDKEFYPVSRISPGWNPMVEKSIFTDRQETIRVPANAARAGLIISSGGAPGVVGIYIVKDITISAISDSGTSSVLLDSNSFLNGNKDLKGQSIAWLPDGDSPSMARLFDLSGGKKGPWALSIIDDNILSHAEWHTDRAHSPKVVPGEHLTIRWKEIYNNGLGVRANILYLNLPIGDYTFKIESVDTWGFTGKTKNSVRIVIPLPYWKNPWFWTCTGAAFLILVAVICHVLIQNRIRRHLERVSLVEKEQTRIAQDLHDDLGARLAHLSLTSSYAESRAPAGELRESITEISKVSQEVISALSHTVWAVNPGNNSLNSLVDFLDKLINDLCKFTVLRCWVEIPATFRHFDLSSDFRHNVTLAVKEAVNNAIKHAQANELRVTIDEKNGLLGIHISDNGCGFIEEQTKRGNGLTNMRRRMESVHGKMIIASNQHGGTTVSFMVPLSKGIAV